MPLALTTRRGCVLNWRFGVNGCQKDCRSFGAPTAASSRLSSSSIAVSLVAGPSIAAANDTPPRPPGEGQRAMVAILPSKVS